MPKARPPSRIPPECLAAYERVIAAVPGEECKGDRMPYTSMNGNMYSFLDETGTLALRLSPAERMVFMERFDTSLHEAHGHVMKEYVTVPPSMLDDLDLVAPWFVASHANAATLKPKATVRTAKC
jgi:hypothetical protein